MKIEKIDNNYFFTPAGELSLRTESAIKKEIIDTLQNDIFYERVTIVLKDVDFIDSSGIGMLIYINKFLNSNKKTLHLKSPVKSVLGILMLGSFDRLFKIENQ